MKVCEAHSADTACHHWKVSLRNFGELVLPCARQRRGVCACMSVCVAVTGCTSSDLTRQTRLIPAGGKKKQQSWSLNAGRPQTFTHIFMRWYLHRPFSWLFPHNNPKSSIKASATQEGCFCPALPQIPTYPHPAICTKHIWLVDLPGYH